MAIWIVLNVVCKRGSIRSNANKSGQWGAASIFAKFIRCSIWTIRSRGLRIYRLRDIYISLLPCTARNLWSVISQLKLVENENVRENVIGNVPSELSACVVSQLPKHPHYAASARGCPRYAACACARGCPRYAASARGCFGSCDATQALSISYPVPSGPTTCSQSFMMQMICAWNVQLLTSAYCHAILTCEFVCAGWLVGFNGTFSTNRPYLSVHLSHCDTVSKWIHRIFLLLDRDTIPVFLAQTALQNAKANTLNYVVKSG